MSYVEFVALLALPLAWTCGPVVGVLVALRALRLLAEAEDISVPCWGEVDD